MLRKFDAIVRGCNKTLLYNGGALLYNKSKNSNAAGVQRTARISAPSTIKTLAVERKG